MVRLSMTCSYASEPRERAQIRRSARQQFADDEVDRIRGRRAARDEHIHLHELVDRPRTAAAAPARTCSPESGTLDSRPRFRRKPRSQHIACSSNALRIDGTLPVTAQSPSETRILCARGPCGSSSRSSSRADRPFDQRHVHVFGKLLDVHQRAVDQIASCRPGRSAARPCRGTTCGSRSSHPARRSRHVVSLISRSSRIIVRYGRNCRRFAISATARPFSDSAPVGQTMHAFAATRAAFRRAPRLFEVGDHARNRCRGPCTSQVCAPSISSHTRTQRVQRMQRL